VNEPVLVTPDGQCVPPSDAHRGTTENKDLFGHPRHEVRIFRRDRHGLKPRARGILPHGNPTCSHVALQATEANRVFVHGELGLTVRLGDETLPSPLTARR
jgi:hypothetical protein